MNMPQLFSPFYCKWSFGLILIFGYFELGCYEYSYAFLSTTHISVKYIPRIKMFSYRVHICSTLDNSVILSTKVDVTVYTSVYDIPAASHPGQHLVLLIFNFRQSSGCLKLSTVLICIFFFFLNLFYSLKR